MYQKNKYSDSTMQAHRRYSINGNFIIWNHRIKKYRIVYNSTEKSTRKIESPERHTHTHTHTHTHGIHYWYLNYGWNDDVDNDTTYNYWLSTILNYFLHTKTFNYCLQGQQKKIANDKQTRQCVQQIVCKQQSQVPNQICLPAESPKLVSDSLAQTFQVVVSSNCKHQCSSQHFQHWDSLAKVC